MINEAAFCNRDCWKLLQTLLQLHRDRLTSKVPLCNLFIQFFKTALIDSIKCGALSNEPISLVDSSLLSCICECFFLSSSTELLQCKVLRPQFDQIVQLGQEAFVFSANYLSEQGVDLISIGLMSNILTVLERCLTSNNPKKVQLRLTLFFQ